MKKKLEVQSTSFEVLVFFFALWTLCSALGAAPAAAQTHLLIVTGLGGDQEHADEFYQLGTSMVDAARKRAGLRDDQVTWLAEDPARDPAHIAGKATREEIQRVVGGLAERAGPADRVLILLIGHGASDGQGARLNLPGPDLSATDLAALLGRFTTQRVVVVNAASASGDFQEPLAGRNRAIITATRSGMERNETVFPRFFVAAFTRDGGDTDKDGHTSVLEAFQYAQREVERHFKDGNHMQSEHAVLAGDQEVARSFFLAAGPAAPAVGATAELRALLEAKLQLETRVEALRGRKAEMDAAQYERELESVLVELALKNQEIRAKGGQ